MATPDATAPAEQPGGGKTAWARNLGAPVRDFLHAETGGAVALIVAAVFAVIWANSPWPESYEQFWHNEFALVFNGTEIIADDLRGWINEGLMALFFLVVGLEAKRELDLGELRERSRIAVPVIAALGGMICAVAVFMAFNAGGDGAKGWGAVMSTDTALALGALAIVTRSRAVRVRVFVLTLVVIDDLAALLVIAIVYSEAINTTALAIAIGLFGVLIGLRYAQHFRGPAAFVVGMGVWFAMFKSGVDPVIAGLAIGLVTSAYPPNREDLERTTDLVRQFREQPTPELAYSAQRSMTAATSPNERLQFRLHPWTSLLIVPLFALANAGIPINGDVISAALGSPITLGIIFGYVVGKPIGIVLFSWIATRPMFGGARLTLTWPAMLGGATAAGIGFTVSLLIISLAFTGEQQNLAKFGVLVAAIISPLVSRAVFMVMTRLPESVRLRQLSGVADQMIDLADGVDEDRDHIRGNPDALVTVVEYADFECPFCGQAEPTIRELLGEDSDMILRYVFRHLPLQDVHPNAQLAAEASEAAAAQGRFWEMHDLLMDHQDHLSMIDLHGYADQLGLDTRRFMSEVRERKHGRRIAEDVESADTSGVSGTPTFFINGMRHYGAYDIATMKAAIRSAKLNAIANQKAAAGAFDAPSPV